jgi:hypothetical protein
MEFQISYDPSLNEKAGYVEITDPTGPDPTNPGNPLKALAPRDRHTLLFLLFKLLYTFEGREFMRVNDVVAGNLTAAKQANLIQYFAANGVTDVAVQTAIINSHIAAQNWADAFKAGATHDPARWAAEKAYMQNMAFVTWSLWEDAKAHEFSMGW